MKKRANPAEEPCIDKFSRPFPLKLRKMKVSWVYFPFQKNK